MQQMFTDRLFVCPSRALARIAVGRGVPTWAYQYNFTDLAEGVGDAAAPVHASELALVFGTFSARGQMPVSLPEGLLSAAMQTLWTNFAQSGSPNGAHNSSNGTDPVPFVLNGTWPRYSLANETVLSINWNWSAPTHATPLEPRNHGRRDAWCDFWDDVCPDGKIFDDSCGDTSDAVSNLVTELAQDAGVRRVAAPSRPVCV